MSWFIFGKKKSSLGCGCQAGSTEVSGRGFMCAEDGVCGCDVRHGGACRVLVLGAGCKSCRVLYEVESREEGKWTHYRISRRGSEAALALLREMTSVLS